MMNLGFSELLLILGIALIVFGPDRLPEIGKGLGRAIRSFKAASAELQGELGTSLDFDLGDADEKAEKPSTAAETAPMPPPPPPVFKADPE